MPHIAPMGLAPSRLVLVGEDRIVGIGAADIGGARAGRGGVVGDAEMQRFEPLRRAGDGMDVLHAERGLDDELETDALLEALCRFDLRYQHVESVDIGGRADLGNHDEVQLVAGLLHDIDDVAVHVVRVEAVDAQRQRLAAPIDVIEPGDHVLARLFLLVRRHRVLEVEKDDVGATFRCFLEELRMAAGHGELAAVEARRHAIDDGEAHDLPRRGGRGACIGESRGGVKRGEVRCSGRGRSASGIHAPTLRPRSK
jgi:hypothetical protein